MGKGVNKVILIGNLGHNPEIKQNEKGQTATVSLATSDTWKDKNSGEVKERTEWHRIIFFNRLAERVGQYLHKGSKIYVEGALRTRKWTDKNGIERYTTEIAASEMQMLDNKQNNSTQYSNQPNIQQQKSPNYIATTFPQNQPDNFITPSKRSEIEASASSWSNDDIPF